MKKSLLIICLTLVMIFMTSCGKTEPTTEAEIPWEERFTTEETGRIGIGIEVGEEGFYSLWGDAELQYYCGNLDGINISNLTLLAYKHSEKWEGGYYVYSYVEIQKIIDTLKQYPELEDIINDLENGLLIDQAST